MWEEPDHRTATAIARPVRMAYLVDLEQCPDRLLDAIFAESYSRWGGRRTLIVPATANGIDERYAEWLRFFDADIIYSFVALCDQVVTDMHERYAPAHLLQHWDHKAVDQQPAFEIRLPYQALSSLSVLPAFCSRPWGFDGRPRNITVLNKFWDHSESRFLEENFGFLIRSFSSGIGSLPETSLPELFTCLTLITPEALADGQYAKDPRAQYETDEDKFLEALGQKGWLLPLVNLSEMFTQYLNCDG